MGRRAPERPRKPVGGARGTGVEDNPRARPPVVIGGYWSTSHRYREGEHGRERGGRREELE